MPDVNFVWAEDLDGWIGKDQSLPWHVSADMKHFKSVTMDHPVIMGRATYDSIGRPLPHRTNLVVTHHPLTDKRVHSLSTVNELKSWLANCQEKQVAVIGGAQLFTELLPIATRLTRTVINGHFNGDTKMPPIDYERWHLTNRQPVIENGEPVCWFEDWVLNVEQD